jgi:hypothetical protein
MTTIVADHLMRKSTMKDINGNIINLIDEANGGYIIRNRQIVNQARWDELQKIEQDKREAALASTKAIESPNAHLRTQTAEVAQKQINKVDELEERLNKQDEKLDAILKALQK